MMEGINLSDEGDTDGQYFFFHSVLFSLICCKVYTLSGARVVQERCGG
jgi:hypothetical protein